MIAVVLWGVSAYVMDVGGANCRTQELMQLLLHLFATKTRIFILICLTGKENQGRMSTKKEKKSKKWQERGDLSKP